MSFAPVGLVDLIFDTPGVSAVGLVGLDFLAGVDIPVLFGTPCLRMGMTGRLVQTAVLSGSIGMAVDSTGTLVSHWALSRTFALPWEVREPVASRIDVDWPAAVPMDARLGVPWNAPRALDIPLAIDWQLPERVARGVDAVWDVPLMVSVGMSGTWNGGPTRKAIGASAAWNAGRSEHRQFGAAYRHPPRRDFAAIMPFGSNARLDSRFVARWHHPVLRNTWQPRLPWGDGEPPRHHRPPRGGAGLPEVVQPSPGRPYGGQIGRVDLCFHQLQPASTDLVFRQWLPPCKYRTTMTMIHNANLVRLPERTPIPFLAASLRYSWGDMAWDASIIIPTAAALALVAPTVSALYEVELELDGYTWWFLVEGYGDDRRYNDPTYTITCRSPSAWLASPYARPAPQATDAPYTAQQLSGLAVSEAGWSIDWRLMYQGDLTPMDWLVPAGAWRHDPMTPAEAVMAIAAAAGGVVEPARAGRSFAIRYAHPVASWDWQTATPDITLAGSRIYRVAGNYTPGTEYDKVYVFGEAGGVGAGVTRDGKAGNTPAPTVVDPLVTHIDCGRERGRQVLSKSGPRLWQTVEAPFYDDFGIQPVWPGQLVEVVDDTTWRGLSTGITIEAARSDIDAPLEVIQTVTLERVAA